MNPTLEHFIALLLQYKYFFLFPIAIIEGPIISILAGVLIARGVMDPWVSYTLLVLGDLIGDGFYYAIGRFGGRPVLNKWGHR